MRKLYLCFMLHIIHLQYRNDKLVLLQNELIAQKIKTYRLWEGILDKEKPQRGISKAHKQIVSWARGQNLPSVMIAEDDIKFTSKDAFNYFIKNEPEEYDLYLGGIYYGNIKADNSVEDFSGLTLYKIHQRFYTTFLSMSEDQHIDRSLANKRSVYCL